jgi:Tol biopolymer transport system component
LFSASFYTFRQPIYLAELISLKNAYPIRMKKIYLSVLFVLLLLQVKAQAPVAAPAPTKGNYQLASKFNADKLRKMVFSQAIDPHWLKLTNRFWYVYETSEIKSWYIVDPATRKKTKMFDNDKLAAEITLIVKDPFDAQHLPIENLKFTNNEKSIQFELKSTVDVVKKDRKDKKAADSLEKKTFYFTYDLQNNKLAELKDFNKVKPKPIWASIAPDSSAIVFSKNFNLYWMDKANYKKAVKDETDTSIVDHQLTKDGIEFYAYGSGRGDDETITDKGTNKKRRPAGVLWSPDSKYFVMERNDQRKVKDLWVINSIAEPRPTLQTYKYLMPGEKETPTSEMLLFDFGTKTFKKLNIALFKDQSIGAWQAPALAKNRDDEFKPSVWLGTADKFYFYRIGRDLKKLDICNVDIHTGKVNIQADERMNTYVEISTPGLINGGKELIEWSERDGWAHFYLYDDAGKMKNRITSGSFHCDDIVRIDEKSRVLYFTASGREPGESPYYVHLYRVNLDGSGLKLLNPGNFNHTSNINDGPSYFVDIQE